MKQKPHPVFPSILSTNYFNLESRLEIFNANQINFIHLDIMDGHFVDNLSFGPSAAKAIKAEFPFKIDAHLMVDNPRKMIPKFIQAGSDWVSVHMETVSDEETPELIAMIKDQGCKAGLALNPDSPVERTFPYLKEIDYVLLMSVFPGYGGQKFIADTVTRAAELKQRIDQEQSRCLIQVDGGINSSNIGPLKKAGADLFVIGTFLFNSQDIPKTLEEIQNNLN